MISPDLPTMVYGLRGLAYFEVRVFGPDKDLHSGVFGGVVHNPAQVLINLISKMHDENGKVTLPHFYDDVLELTNSERAELARLNLDDDYFQGQTGTSQLWGEDGYTSIERVGARPTLEVNGFLSGFTGVGSKTIIPAKAMAKISTRLVPNQEPEKVHQYLIEFFKLNAPDSVRWEIEMISGGHPSISDLELPETRAMIKALEQVWGKSPVFKREGGSVPDSRYSRTTSNMASRFSIGVLAWTLWIGRRRSRRPAKISIRSRTSSRTSAACRRAASAAC